MIVKLTHLSEKREKKIKIRMAAIKREIVKKKVREDEKLFTQKWFKRREKCHLTKKMNKSFQKTFHYK